jgi:hypothetical protein
MVASFEERISRLEQELARLKKDAGIDSCSDRQWKRLVGVFAGDPAFPLAMAAGRKYRETLRPKPRKRRGQ